MSESGGFPEVIDSTARPGQGRVVMLRRLLLSIVLIAIAVAASIYGYRLRDAAWHFSADGHFVGDISNAFRWGTRALNHGLLEFYDNVEAGKFDASTNDYPPLRITVATRWREWVHKTNPAATAWDDTYEMTYPMLRLNTIAEAAASVLTLLIICRWRRVVAGEYATWRTGLIEGLAGGIVFWFNPAVLWDGHCWPQWDVWLVPFFLLAVLLALFDFWLFAGISLAIGGCLKGQMLLVAPMLILWPLFQLRFGAALRCAIGFFTGLAVIVFPFMHPSKPAFFWFFMVLLALAIVMPVAIGWFKEKKLWISGVLTLVAVFVAWPWKSDPAQFWSAEYAWRLKSIAPACVLIVACSRFIRADWRVFFYIATITTSAFLVMPLFGASSAWYRIGFVSGTEKFARMLEGTGVYNLPAMARRYYEWPQSTTDTVVIPYLTQKMEVGSSSGVPQYASVPLEITVTQFSRYIFFSLLTICAIGAAIHHKRRDPRFLASLVAPWLIFYMVLTQMHGRYPVWAAAFSGLLFGVSTGMGLLGVIVTLVATLGIMQNQLAFRSQWWQDMYDFAQKIDPHVGWVLVVAGLIYLYHAIIPSVPIRWRRKPKPKAAIIDGTGFDIASAPSRPSSETPG